MILNHGIHAYIGAADVEAQGVARALKHFGGEFEIGESGDALAHTVYDTELHPIGFGGYAAEHEIHRVTVDQLRGDFFLHQRVVAPVGKGGEHHLVAITPTFGTAEPSGHPHGESFAGGGHHFFVDVA